MGNKYIDRILKDATTQGASDVHIMINNVYFRIDGELIKKEYSMSLEQVDEVIRSMAGEDRQELSNDMDFSYSSPELGRFRVNVAKQRGTYCATIRHIKTEIPSFEDLGVPEDILRVCKQKKGLFIVTGPTGSGKSTTLASMINYINKNMSKKVVTIEDPIEYLHRNDKSVLTQREVGSDTSFSQGLRSVLRQDPDVILIGEMRDKETMETALTAAETGHLVLSTLHTKDAVSSINRIVDMFPAEQKTQILAQLGDNLIGIFSQNLIPSLKGGLVLGYEKLIMDRTLRNQIKNDNIKYIKQTMQTTKECLTIEKHLDELVREKYITSEQKLELLPKE